VGDTGGGELQDGSQNGVEPAKHISRGHPNDLVAAAPQEGIAAGVVGDGFVGPMLATVDLDHQAPRMRSEIRVIGADRHLPAKMQWPHLLEAKCVP
jgi:hypothetical protein